MKKLEGINKLMLQSSLNALTSMREENIKLNRKILILEKELDQLYKKLKKYEKQEN